MAYSQEQEMEFALRQLALELACRLGNPSADQVLKISEKFLAFLQGTAKKN